MIPREQSYRKLCVIHDGAGGPRLERPVRALSGGILETSVALQGL